MNTPIVLFIQKNNQELLWNTMNQTPQFSVLSYKEDLFRNAIQTIYNKYENYPHYTTTLNQLNRETISFIVSIIKNGGKTQNSIIESRLETEKNTQYNKFITKEEEMSAKQEAFTREFGERQQEYEKMTQKPILPDVNFKETMEDTPIENMESLIQKHLKEREEELQKYTNSIQGSSLQQKESPKELSPKDKQSKSLSWIDETFYHSFLELQKKCEKQETKIKSLEEQIEIINRKIDEKVLKNENKNNNENSTENNIKITVEDA
jgi:hypothetical protein